MLLAKNWPVMIPEIPRLNNCWECDISSGSLKRGDTVSIEGSSFLGMSSMGECMFPPLPPEISKNLSL